MNIADNHTLFLMTYSMVHPVKMWTGLNDTLGRSLSPAQWQAMFMLYYEMDTIDPLRLSFETDEQAAWALEGLAESGLASISRDHPTGCLAKLSSDGMDLMDDAGAALLAVCEHVMKGLSEQGGAYS